ncbi:hypothetical protein F4703DRAFT_1793908 [Phycomyces blakesleeanus]
MRYSDLPFEILEHVSDYLSTNDKRSCSLTCKGWRYPFQKALWRYIRVKSYSGVQKLIRSIKKSQYVSTTYGLSVYSLRIYGSYLGIKTSDIEFSELFKHLPNLRCLHLELITYKRIYTDITSSDKIWTSLETLKIQWEYSSFEQEKINFFECIKACIMLRELEIRRGLRNELLYFSMNDFDNMPNNLKNLSSISVYINHNHDFLPTLDTIPNTAPVFSVASLNINWDEIRSSRNESWNIWSPLWLYYLGYKYPNLRSLRLNIKPPRMRVLNRDNSERTISLLRSNQNAFRHMETLDLIRDQDFKLSKCILLELFIPLRVPLRHLTLDPGPLGDLNSSYSMDVIKVLESFSSTLQSFSARGFQLNLRDKDPSFKLYSYYPLLTNLCINSIDVYLDFGQLLDRCVALKELQFCAGTLVINPNTTTETSTQQQQQQQHGLQILTLRKCSVAFEVFNYLSSRCRSLKHMTLYTLNIKGFIYEKTGCLLLNMPHTFLKTLTIGHIQYVPPYERTNVYNQSRLTLLSQLNDFPSSEDIGERKRNETDSEHHVLTSHRIAWIYTYYTFGPFENGRVKTTRLSKSGADIAFKYFQNFPPKCFFQTLEHKSLYDEEFDDMTRACELHKGYGQFKFGKIESVHVVK